MRRLSLQSKDGEIAANATHLFSGAVDWEPILKAVLEASPEGAVVIDDKGRIQYFSAVAEQLFDQSAEDMIGQTLNILMPEPYRSQHDGYLSHHLQTGENRIIGVGRIVTGQRRDGSTFPMQLTVGAARWRDQRIFIGFVYDLTRRQRFASRLQELQEDLERASRVTTMGEMAAALAHELNQPLSAVALYLRGAKRLIEKNEQAADGRIVEALDKAAEQALRAGDVIRRLRDYLGRGERERRPESLERIVQDACALAFVGARDRGVNLTVQIDPECDHVVVDRIEIQQVLINLLRNAMDAMDTVERREVSIRAHPSDDSFVVVEVADTGAGVDDGVRDALFKPFTTTKKEGMGVGLSICRSIIGAHGGRIWADSEVGGGSIFRFTLPREGGEPRL